MSALSGLKHILEVLRMNILESASIVCAAIPVNRVWLYCRVAKHDPVEIQFQKHRLRAVAHRNGWMLAGASSDELPGVSFSRPGLSELTAAIENNEVDMVMVCNLSRLFRRVDEALTYLKYLRSHGVSIYSLAEGLIDLDEIIAVFEALLALSNPDDGTLS